MAKKALILGPSGGGKSHSLQYWNPAESWIINPDKKELPWRGFEQQYHYEIKDALKDGTWVSIARSNYYITRSLIEIGSILKVISDKCPKIKNVSLDTISHAMNKSVMDTLSVGGYDKFKIYAQEFYNLMEIIDGLRADLFVSVHAHVEIVEGPGGKKTVQFKVPAGKFTREVLEPESLFTVVLFCQTKLIEGLPVHYFLTQTDGTNTAKSPVGMFPLTIDNNMQVVRDRMYAYYSGGELADMPALLTSDSF